MTIFGFELWPSASQSHIRDGQKRIGDGLHLIADDLHELRERNRAAMGLPVGDGGDVKILPPVARKGRGGK